MPSDPNTVDHYAGFSSAELLRRARVLRDIAKGSSIKERRRFDNLAWEHEEAARKVRARSKQE
jgi:hypothetical protein